MALKKCSFCGKPVSTKADRCAYCHEPTRLSARLERKHVYASIITVLIMLAVVLHSPSKAKQQADKPRVNAEEIAKRTEQHKVDDAACKADLQCYGDRNVGAAGVYCREPIEKLAKFSFRWTDRTFEQKFKARRWLDKDQLTLTFAGDKIEFKNQYGAFQPHHYECDFDPASNAVYAVRAHAGRL